jgi:hypothetical protein
MERDVILHCEWDLCLAQKLLPAVALFHEVIKKFSYDLRNGIQIINFFSLIQNKF